MKNKNQGITLIALVITIIILLILAGVAISSLTGKDGMLAKINQAAEESNKKQALEELRLKVMEVQLDKGANTTLKDIVDKLEADEKNEYIITLTQAYSIRGEIPDLTNAKEIYVTYKNYQFKIDNNLVVTFVGENDSDDSEEDIPEDIIEKSKYIQTGLKVYLDAKETNAIENSIWKDLSGNQNNGTIIGATLDEDKVTFDGVDDWVNLGEQNFGNVTLELIFDVSELPNKDISIFNNYEAGGYGLDVNANNLIRGETYISGNYLKPVATEAIKENTKYKATLTSNGKETKLYVNGNLIRTDKIENGIIELPNMNTVLAIGTNPVKDGAQTGFFNGSVYLVRAYNRVLSEDEIKLNYNYDNNRFSIDENYFKNIEYKDDTYKIATVSELEQFRDQVNSGNTFEGKYIQLQDDLDLSKITSWTPIGTTTNPFKGLFDGNGHNITNLNVDNSTSIQGLFGKNEGIITDINIKSGTIKGTYRVGAIVGYNAGNVINCSNSAKLDATSYHVGGICGYNSGNIQKCYNTGECYNTGTSIAGIAGRSDALVKYCYNTGKIETTSYAAAGIVGTSGDSTVSGCYNTGIVTAKGYSTGYNSLTGGIIGNTIDSSDANDGEGTTTVKHCYNTGSITGTGSIVGGIVGNLNGSVTYCYNTGTITAERGDSNNSTIVGGIVGMLNTDAPEMKYCYNTGTVSGLSGTTKYLGGVAGYNKAGSTITNSYTLSTVISTTIGSNKGTSSNVASKTDADMKTTSFVSLLGGSGYWGYQFIENSHPKLYWE